MKIVEMNENDAIWSYEFWPTCEECGREIKNIKSGKWVWFQDRDDNPPTLLCNTCIVEEIKQINRRIHKNYPAKK